MRKYFLYELKKHLWTLVILTALCAVPYVMNMATMRMYYVSTVTDPMKVVLDSGINGVFIPLLILLFAVPILMYSFKMSKRGVDGYYSLPLKKEKMYFVLTMVGLILVLVPYTVSFWGGFFTLLCRQGNPYRMGYYVPTYFAGLCFAIFLYGVNAFVFTRANRVSDGVIYMVAYAFVGSAIVRYIESNCLPQGSYIGYRITNAFIFSGGMFQFVDSIQDLICGSSASFRGIGWWFGLTVGAGVICYALFFYLLRFEKGEDAEQNSESWFGYRVLIPVYMSISVGGAVWDSISLIVALVFATVATIVHKRTFRLKGEDFIPSGIGIVLGFLLRVLFG